MNKLIFGDFAQTRQSHEGFTLIELLVVIAIIGVLSAILIPVISSVRDSANNSKCKSNLRSLSSAYNLMTIDNDGILIPAIRGGDVPDSKWWFDVSWNRSLGEYLENNAPGERLSDMNCPYVIELTGSPSERSSYAFNHFLGKSNDEGQARRGALRFIELENPAMTIMFGDSNVNDSGIDTPQSLNRNRLHAYHGGMAYVSYFDGHVGEVDPEVLRPISEYSEEGSILWRGFYH